MAGRQLALEGVQQHCVEEGKDGVGRQRPSSKLLGCITGKFLRVTFS